ncbi:hypothetical protein HNR77_002951 [Paenibacillus sp. JGP012]|uniref:hypothetical protein n=1 Tax=Paenibacillus sp. JGP012 TaxID=2735914 RepID=UPI001610C7C1|nr:hypothetical protein [Paenibacillus sp. JGP012]MBB6021856.1 hypothetical protein [Paenibacillus sp. JGP012]
MKIVWRKEWVNEYESPWSVFEKLSLVNLVERNEILKVFGIPKVKNIKQNIGDYHRNLLLLNGFDLQKLHQALDFNLLEHNKNTIHALIAPFHALYSSRSHWFHEKLLWCPKCMERGFHSWLHQFKLLDKCAFHNLNLVKSCPDCNETIPFLLSNKQLGYAFKCKCGFTIASFNISSWNEWTAPEQIDQAILEWIRSNMYQLDVQPRWIVHEQHCSLKLLIKAEPKETKHIESIESLYQNDYYSQRFQQIMLRNCLQTFRQVEDKLLKNLLRKHQHCITQLMELRKMNDIAEFPEICPYAYAYVFWRKALLKKEYFYDENGKGDSSEEVPLLIEEHLEYFSEQIVSLQMKTQKCIDTKILFWILEKIIIQFSENFFNAWLEIAGERSKKISAPSWNEINEMRNRSFPIIAFKYNFIEKSSSSCVEYHHLENEEMPTYKYVCPYQHENAIRNTYTMKSYTPQAVAILIRGDKDVKNKTLQKSVDAYVKKLSFFNTR